MHFNSHAHVERDYRVRAYDKATGISTHTLTWSVTPQERSPEECFWISTHTLTWSVTGTEVYNGGNQIFQLTRSRGA